MSKHNVYQYYSTLTPTTKGIIVVSGVAVSLLIAYKIYAGLKAAKLHNTEGMVASQSVSDLNYLIKNNIAPSYLDSQYETWSDELVNAFSGCGVDFGTVLSVFNNLQNEADLVKLISTYGTRNYNKCMSWIYIFGSGIKNYSLPSAIGDKLSADQINQIDNILATKGIKYRF
ncbi:MAG: hypothetical protein ACRDE2_00045 [Chitinophagaceae bacterium]